MTLLTRALPALLSISMLSAQAHAEGPLARVTVRSEEPDLVIGEVKSRAIASSGNYTAVGMNWDERCTAPCSFELQPGLRELVFRSPNLFFFKEMRVRPGENNLYVDRGSPAMRITGNTLAVLGVLSLVVGGSILITRAVVPETDSDGKPNSFREKTTWALPLTIGGAVGMAGGLTLSYIGRVKVEEMAPGGPGGPGNSGGQQGARVDQGWMLRANGTF
jgi:hypothetical protein